MGAKQQSVGKQWEQEILGWYYNKGYYTEKRDTGFHGTLYDIMVAKNGSVMFIEAKHITKEKLYFKSSGLYKKKDEIDNFIKRTNNNIYLFIKSDISGTFWTTWVQVRDILEEKGYITLEDCIPMSYEKGE